MYAKCRIHKNLFFFSFLCMWAETVELNDPRLEKCSFSSMVLLCSGWWQAKNSKTQMALKVVSSTPQHKCEWFKSCSYVSDTALLSSTAAVSPITWFFLQRCMHRCGVMLIVIAITYWVKRFHYLAN